MTDQPMEEMDPTQQERERETDVLEREQETEENRQPRTPEVVFDAEADRMRLHVSIINQRPGVDSPPWSWIGKPKSESNSPLRKRRNVTHA